MPQKHVWILVMKRQHLVVPVLPKNIPVRKSFNPRRRKVGNINTELKQYLSFDKNIFIMSVFKNQIHWH